MDKKLNHTKLFRRDKSNFKLLDSTFIKLKKPLSLVCVAIVLSACAAFSGRETTGEYVDDMSITASVKNEIFQDPQLKIFQIHVETFKNQVQLSGFVDSRKEYTRAEQIARNVKGVESVKNNLIVRRTKKR